MNKRRLLMLGAAAAWLQATGCTTTSPTRDEPSASTRRRELAADADAALRRLHTEVPGSADVTTQARGILVFPRVVTAGFVVGGSYGEGRLSGRSIADSYYKIASGSLGWLAGAQSRTMILCFMTQDALEQFMRSPGWTVGVDASVAVAKAGANGVLDTKTVQAPIVGFVMTNAGLMADLSLTGTKFIKSEP